MEKRGVLGEEPESRSQEGGVWGFCVSASEEGWRLRYPPDVIRATRFTPRATGIMTAKPTKTER
jgi:hypothetical protein